MTNDGNPARASTYVDYLPAVYSAGDGFLATLLRAFEHVLTGVGDAGEPGLEEFLDGATTAQGQLAGIHRYFDPGLRGTKIPPLQLPEPQAAPDDFLPWLARWVALIPRSDVSNATLRLLIARAVELYRVRGTKQGLVELLSIYGLDVAIDDSKTPLHFTVTWPQKTTDQGELARWRTLASSIIDLEKPAYTTYDLDPKVISWQVEVDLTSYPPTSSASKVGVTTLLADDENLPPQ